MHYLLPLLCRVGKREIPKPVSQLTKFIDSESYLLRQYMIHVIIFQAVEVADESVVKCRIIGPRVYRVGRDAHAYNGGCLCRRYLGVRHDVSGENISLVVFLPFEGVCVAMRLGGVGGVKYVDVDVVAVLLANSDVAIRVFTYHQVALAFILRVSRC